MPAAAGGRARRRLFPDLDWTVGLSNHLIAALTIRREESSPDAFKGGSPSLPKLGIERVHAGNQRDALGQDQREHTQRRADEQQHFLVGVGR